MSISSVTTWNIYVYICMWYVCASFKVHFRLFHSCFPSSYWTNSYNCNQTSRLGIISSLMNNSIVDKMKEELILLLFAKFVSHCVVTIKRWNVIYNEYQRRAASASLSLQQHVCTGLYAWNIGIIFCYWCWSYLVIVIDCLGIFFLYIYGVGM